ncbi:hypothetical protein [Microvirga massiliensis]|nr:hypothetical protein [Microvirga massiliensis]
MTRVVRTEDGTYEVLDDEGNTLKGGFQDEEAAWGWWDEYEEEELTA